MNSPYANIPVQQWDKVTQELINSHPLGENEIVEIVLEAWEAILCTKIGNRLQFGVDCLPPPQLMGNYLHMLIPSILSERYPNIWRREFDKNDKDVVYIPDDKYSFEIKTSSQNSIYGNRSYGQENSNHEGKQKFGFYLAVNFEKFTKNNTCPQIKKIKFGWLDHSDWKAQLAATGQNSTLDKNAWNYKLKLLYTYSG